MMKSSTLFECGSLPPTSTSRPLDIIHVIGVPRPSLFFCHTECKLKNKKKQGRPENTANLQPGKLMLEL